ncbi:dnaJ-like subfamily B member 13 [Solea senegalensis]|uniref:DnaJ homolog subfamily B member 13 n=1 Tax=Solea senegalensis TaxID=28829 RepID=A0AAV6SGD3_SOLSE|nr:dnaJ homolog subfamily B member 13-like [Solea senegalensis]KAG7515547.1 dnaJ-like subfamily B member 13 [Solea senegalensis]
MTLDYYETLELNRDATDADIKKAYRRLALKFHPSSNRKPGSSEKFTQLSEAYDVLSDPKKKAIYDKFGEEGLKGGIPPEFGNDGAWSCKYTYHGRPDKTFRQFFGGDNPFADFHTNEAPLRFGGLQHVVVKTQDPPVERDLHLSLEELFHGCTKQIKICRRELTEDTQSSIIRQKIQSIDINPGLKEGTRIIFFKEGDQGPNNIPADIVFIVRQKNHPQFKRQDNDLIYKAHVSLEMALTGFSVDVETLDGRLLTIPINDIVHPMSRKLVSGEGMPLSQDPSQKGNLIITFHIHFPERLSPEQRYLIKKALK